MMLAIPDVLTATEMRRIRAALDGASWSDGRDTAGHMARRVKNNQQLDAATAVELGAFVLDRLGQSERFIAAALPLRVLPPRFNRYAGGGSYGEHVDNAVLAVPGTGVRIRGDLSATLFLSDPDEYAGGELVIRGEVDTHRVRLPAGHLILYSASTLHQVTPVTRGARLAAFFWIQSLVRDHHRRAMLLELDDAIRAIHPAAPEHPALARLTGLYHNLLRHWAET